MHIKKNKLYFFLLIACFAGYIWLFYNINAVSNTNSGIEICPFKRVTTLPCPSCGSTRSVIALISGDLQKALLINPLGFLIAVVLLVLPFWLLYDLILKKDTFLKFYKDAERFLRRPKIAFLFVSLVLINWIWNIIKDL